MKEVFADTKLWEKSWLVHAKARHIYQTKCGKGTQSKYLVGSVDGD